MKTRTSRYWRTRAAAVQQDLYTMELTQVSIADRCGWDDPVIDEIECDIVAARTQRAYYLGLARTVDAATAGLPPLPPAVA